jgi:hypothetical protein
MPRSQRHRLRASTKGYPANWQAVQVQVKRAAAGKCVRCGQEHNPKAGQRLQVHHLDMNKANQAEWNLVPLCQPCRLVVQAMEDWEQGRLFPVEDWLMPYRLTYLAILGITEPWVGALGGLENLSSLERRLVIGTPSPTNIPINGDLGLRGSLRRLMGPAIYVEGSSDTWLEVYQYDGDYLVFRLGSRDSIAGDYFGQFNLLEAAKGCVREIKEGVITESKVRLEGTRLPWGST